MSEREPAIEARGEGRFAISGPMTFATAPALLARAQATFAAALKSGPVELDLSAVGKADSAGLALLIEWVSWTRAGNGSLRFTHMPEQLLAIAKLSEVDELLTAE